MQRALPPLHVRLQSKGRQIIKSLREKFFNWTPQDVADWEKIRSKGLLRFTLGYGLALFGGVLFVLISLITLVVSIWNKTPTAGLIQKLIFIALVCLLGGLVTGLSTWVMEEKLYVKFKKIHSQENNQSD